MFHTFNVTAPAQSGPDRRLSSAGPLFAKRQKVSRACDRCRTFRTKCGEKPCSRCVIDKVRCVTTSSSPAVKQKTKTLDSTRRTHHTISQANNCSPAKRERFLTPATAFSNEDDGGRRKPSAHAAGASETSTVHGSRKKLDDHIERPSCPAYLFAKIESFFARPRPALRTSANGATVNLKTANPGPFPDLPQCSISGGLLPRCSEYLTKDQENYFLRLFWEAYHPLLQASDESEFQSIQHLDRRKGSGAAGSSEASTDCMIALGIQYGYGAGLTSRILSLRCCSVSMSSIGYEYFRRCHDQISHLTEPTHLSMQCYALMSLYLMNASQFKEAYSLLGTAIRLSHSVNLHEEPSERLQTRERIFQRQIWWLLFTLDIRCSQQLGKPVAVQTATITCSLPSVDELTGRPGNMKNYWDSLHISAYFTHTVKFAVTLAEINRVISPSKLYEDVADVAELEQRASLLATSIASLEKWRQELPDGLLSSRESTGHTECMSVADTPVILELGAPNWLHIQRVLLEVYYHNAYVMLQRPFICFAQCHDIAPFQRPQTDEHALSSLQHAIALTTIIHGLCSSSDVLFGWPAVLHPLWNATVTTIGYILVNPMALRSRKAMQSIFKALAVFEGFATTDSFAAQAEELTRSLLTRLNDILADLDENIETRGSSRTASTSSPHQSPISNSTTPSEKLTDILTDPVAEQDLEHTFGDPLFTDDSLCSSIGAVDIDTWAAFPGQVDMWDGQTEGAINAVYIME